LPYPTVGKSEQGRFKQGVYHNRREMNHSSLSNELLNVMDKPAYHLTRQRTPPLSKSIDLDEASGALIGVAMGATAR